MPQDPSTSDPLISSFFMLDMSGKVTGSFQEVSGISSETEVAEMKIVNQNGIQLVRKVPGRLKWGDITLKRGITDNLEIWKWRKEVEDGKVAQARINGTITMMDQAGAPVAQWNLTDAWPQKVTGPAIAAEGSTVVVEELVIVCEGFERVS